MTASKQRLDLRLVAQGLVATRSRAQALVMAGQVQVNGTVETKSGRLLAADDDVQVMQGLPYVSRGGLKLEKALVSFDIHPSGWQVADIGASTGGFTDCWLQNGVSHVYAVDVGYGQLDWGLRQDPRVSVFERTNARYLTRDTIGVSTLLDGASIDVSFIGLRLVLRPLKDVVSPGGSIVALVKPQFEAGPEKLGRGGVVRDPRIHEEVLYRILDEVQMLGYAVRGMDVSPIRGPEGNIEFLMHLGQDPKSAIIPQVDEIIARAWKMGESHD